MAAARLLQSADPPLLPHRRVPKPRPALEEELSPNGDSVVALDTLGLQLVPRDPLALTPTLTTLNACESLHLGKIDTGEASEIMKTFAL